MYDIKREWPSGLRHCKENWMVPSLNPTWCSTGLKDPTSLQDSQWPSGHIAENEVINIKLVRLSSQEWPKVILGIAKLAVKKKDL